MWLTEVEQYSTKGGKDIVKLLVGNKIDQSRVVPRSSGEDWARNRGSFKIIHNILYDFFITFYYFYHYTGMLFMEASAKTKEGITQVFNEVVQKVST